jgi:FkbM family methyltransferase
MKMPPRKSARFAVGAVFVLTVALSSTALGFKAGINYKVNRLLFELSKRDSLLYSIRQTIGADKTYSRDMQDLWIARSVFRSGSGYYVDVGSADGIVNSNTKLLDDLGWNGICVDPFPKNMSKRTCRVFTQPVFSESGKKVSFRAAGEIGGITDTLQTNKASASRAPVVELVTTTLDDILAQAKAPRRINYINIDIEGGEFEALRGLSFDRYEVDAFTIEHNNETTKRQHIRQLLESKGFVLARSWMTDDWYVRQDRCNYKFRLDLGLRSAGSAE